MRKLFFWVVLFPLFFVLIVFHTVEAIAQGIANFTRFMGDSIDTFANAWENWCFEIDEIN